MSNTTEIAIWVPLRPGASWRGEGVAQTIENILDSLPDDIVCNLVVSKSHVADLADFAESHPNVRIKSVGIVKKKRCIIDAGAPISATLGEMFATKFEIFRFPRLRSIAENFGYILALYSHYIFQRMGFFLPDVRTFWFPSPVIPGLSLLKGKKVYSFWDPFVFEYREFSDISHVLLKKFCSMYAGADVVVTQSQANKSFLISVLSICPSVIEVISNGSPDYSKFLPQLEEIGNRNKDALLAAWLNSKYVGENRRAAVDRMVSDQINKSVFWRLLYKLRSDQDVVVMVSTQARPYKGFGVLMELMDRLVSAESEFQFQFIFTSEIPEKDKQKYPLLYERIHEITRVSNKQHAALYFVADLVLHPSYVEGGVGAYPQFEGASLGTPALVNCGRHMLEPSVTGLIPASTVSNFSRIDLMILQVNELMKSESLRALNIAESKRLAVSWKRSSERYAEIFRRQADVY